MKQMTASFDSYQFDSVIGELQNRSDVYIHFGRVDAPLVNKFLTNQARADWLRTNHPALIPQNDPSGNPPSDKTVATIFQVHYNSPSFRQPYLVWLRGQHV